MIRSVAHARGGAAPDASPLPRLNPSPFACANPLRRSKLLPCGHRSLVRTQVLGTAQYAPPEALTAGRISRATDIYSLAMISE